jgi:hypothetical protein
VTRPSAVQVWRYVLELNGWLATVFLDARGTLAIHSAFGSASIHWEVADGGDPRVAIGAQTEDNDSALVQRLTVTSMRPKGTVEQIVRTVFPRLRKAVRDELVREHGVTRFAEVLLVRAGEALPPPPPPAPRGEDEA